ncbi:hypothetical protein RRF57_003180 [Xylaria bambusicola]|uniref:Uncharacterized protein n=1 Tax=Xylaria bambusicola TaxID=326684 RepID=A0AAN7U7M0_9PEZI
MADSMTKIMIWGIQKIPIGCGNGVSNHSPNLQIVVPEERSRKSFSHRLQLKAELLTDIHVSNYPLPDHDRTAARTNSPRLWHT